MRRTEGWPGGLHLAALALQRRPDDSPVTLFTGGDRLVTDYLIDEVLADYPEEMVRFLLRSSVLERMSPPMLDDLLGITSSGERLLEIEKSGNLFLVPLDDERRWFRYHQLFREALRGRLELLDHHELQRLERRVSELLEQQGDTDGAIRHALAAGDHDRASALVAAHSYGLVNEGLVERLRTWVELLGRGLHRPERGGRRRVGVVRARQWVTPRSYGDTTAAADRLSTDVAGSGGAPPSAVAAALVRAIMGIDGVDGVVRDTEIVRDAGDAKTNPWWAAATMIQGTALAMEGDLDLAEDRLQSARRAITGSPLFEAGILSHLANLRLEQDDLAEATKLSTLAIEIAELHRLDGVLVAVSVYAIAALVAARSGEQVCGAKRVVDH